MCVCAHLFNGVELKYPFVVPVSHDRSSIEFTHAHKSAISLMLLVLLLQCTIYRYIKSINKPRRQPAHFANPSRTAVVKRTAMAAMVLCGECAVVCRVCVPEHTYDIHQTHHVSPARAATAQTKTIFALGAEDLPLRTGTHIYRPIDWLFRCKRTYRPCTVYLPMIELYAMA